MAFYINETLYFDFYLNGYQLPVTVGNINSFVIVYNVYDQLPAIRLDIIDNKGLFQDGSLTDGSILSVMIGKNPDEAAKNVMEFQLVGVPDEKKETTRTTYLLYGVLHKPRLWKCVEPLAIKGTSNQALQTLASKNKLSFDGTITQDEMVWLNGLGTYCDFIDYIVDHGYSTTGSCMNSVITPSSKLIYKDINDLQPKYGLTNISSNQNKQYSLETFPYSEVQFVNKAGVSNFYYGYQNGVTRYSIDGSIQQFNDITVTKQDSVMLNVNKNIYNETGIVRNELLTFDIGNTHPFWTKAYYQNKRFRSLNSIKATVYVKQRTPIEVLDKIKLDFMNPNANEVKQSQASYWIVESKTLAISKQHYIEKFVLSTTGKSLDLYNTTF